MSKQAILDSVTKSVKTDCGPIFFDDSSRDCFLNRWKLALGYDEKLPLIRIAMVSYLCVSDRMPSKYINVCRATLLFDPFGPTV